MEKTKVSQDILRICSKITSKRPKTVIDHILKYGYITTEELQMDYGYDHPPRAARDVREQGVPLETFYVESARSGRKIAAYKFGDPSQIKHGRIGGRKAFSKKFKEDLIKFYNSRDCITNEQWEPRYLQIDHRIPYEILGDKNFSEENLKNYMLLTASSQRAKSWSCEHCENFLSVGDVQLCSSCYWASPENYQHVALSEIKIIHIEWNGSECFEYEQIKSLAQKLNKPLSEFIKEVLAAYARKQ